MPGNRDAGPNDAELLTRIGLIPTAEATTGELAIGIPERAAHLSEVLNHYDSIVLIEGDIRMYQDDGWRKAQQERFGQYAAYEMQGRKHQKHQDLLMAARREFDAAYGFNILQDYEPGDRQAIQADADREYAAFELQFRGSSDMRLEKRRQMRLFYKEQIIGEIAAAETIEPVITVEASTLDPSDKVSLITALKPEFVYTFLNRAPEDFAGVTENDVRRAHPGVIKPALVSKRNTNDNALAQPAEGGGKIYVTFSPAEYPSILRTDPKFPGNKEFNRVERSQRSKPQNERDSDAPRRAKIHVSEDVDNWMKNYTSSVLQPSLELIERFREASRFNGGLARFGNVMNMQTQLDYLWNNIVGDMLWAARIATDESPEWEESTRLAMEKAVYFATSAADQLRNFNAILDLAAERIDLEISYMAGRSEELQRYIYEQQTPKERRAQPEQLPESA